MARRTKTPQDIIENITQATLEDVMHKSMIPYAEHVILERALPRVEDGLKPVQRRILYTMYELAINPDKPHRKCARIVGDCLGKYHPHGDLSVYDALVRLAQDFTMRYPLVDGHGNFGSIDGDSPAAMRYTEARMQYLSLEMLRDINKNTVPFMLNFEDELQEPELLPSRFPNLLVNGSTGIAVGLATNIPPHNLSDTIDATIAVLKNPNIDIDSLIDIIKAPDFPTGAYILNSDEIRNAYISGKGKIKIRSKIHIEESAGGRNLIVIDEIPYQVNKAAMLEKIHKLTEDKSYLYGKIYSIRDESDRNGLRAVIETKKDVDVQNVLAILYKYSDLEVTYGINMVAIADGKPRLLNLKTAIEYYVKFQKDVVLKRTLYDLEKAKIRLEILQGLIVAIKNIDEVIKVIRKSKSPKEANKALCEEFNITALQAQAILDMRLQRLTNLEMIEIEKEHNIVSKELNNLNAIVSSDAKLTNLIVKELNDLKEKNTDNRKTEIIEDDFANYTIKQEEEKVIEYTVSFSSDYKIQKKLTKDYTSELNSDDIDLQNIILHDSKLNSNQKLMLFTNLSNVYQISSDNIPTVSKKSDRGLMLNAIIPTYDIKEKLLYFLPLQNEYQKKYLVAITKNGMIKATPIEEYIINRSKYNSIKLKNDDEITTLFLSDLNEDILITTKLGYAIRFDLKTINTTARMTSGVSAMQIHKDDEVIFASEISDNTNIFISSNKGYTKSILISDIESQNRNGKGVKIFNLLKNATNGNDISSYIMYSGEQTFAIYQKKSGLSLINSSEISLHNKSSNGSPTIICVLDDTVKNVYAIKIKNE